MNHTFGSYVRQKRDEYMMSGGTLAERMGISRSYLCDIEKDRRKPASDSLINKLSAALCVNPEYLFYLAGRIPPDIVALECEPMEAHGGFTEFRGSVRRSRVIDDWIGEEEESVGC